MGVTFLCKRLCQDDVVPLSEGNEKKCGVAFVSLLDNLEGET